MRPTIVGIALLFAAASGVHAQAAPAVAALEQAEPRAVESPTATVEAPQLSASVEIPRDSYKATEAVAPREVSVRSVLTIIGAIVVVVALVSLIT